ncbi:hypothetical protein N7505_001879 [Penicillium chrysogenum]|uniref:Uncharacterized protein n=1 Tax=Penicillium chrysogenum TaxID=5076 RepID=A0ABQ8WY46_PENCH|nr:hypothetical protein N7524_009423 [Penicillium chrysogenum]KAJ5283899.1 hypothetical protein N7505_001879 [Penicillium chrysogenum]
MVLIAFCVFAMVLLPQITQYIPPLNLRKDDHYSVPQPIPYNPYPQYNSAAWKRKWKGSYQSCVGPDGTLLDPENENTAMKGYRWNQSEFPTPIFGSYQAWDLDKDLCVDPSSRYGVYGYEVNARENVDSRSSRNWGNVNWAAFQSACLEQNRERYNKWDPEPKKPTLHKQQNQQVELGREKHHYRKSRLPRFHHRTAVILRSTIDMKYTTNDIHNIRAMVMELSLLSGAEYEVIILVDAKDQILPNPMDNAAMDSLKRCISQKSFGGLQYFSTRSFWGTGTRPLTPTRQCTNTSSQCRSSHSFVENTTLSGNLRWMPGRYTGHLYHLLEQATAFAKRQPRKHLWERNSYFYIPTVHGTWDEFNKMVDQDMADLPTIWGPVPVEGLNFSKEAPFPPPMPTAEINTSSWGIGEEADVITWLPQFNPVNTGWPMRDVIYGFSQGPHTPRRSSPVAMSRLSARLLHMMHNDLVEKGLGLGSEMSPTSWALYYGFKSVQIPQPVYHAQKWDPDELNRRANSGEPGAISAGSDSIWTWDMHHDILKNMTYMFDSEYPGRLYRAWLGNGDADEWKRANRFICLPPMLLHPVKNTTV